MGGKIIFFHGNRRTSREYYGHVYLNPTILNIDTVRTVSNVTV
jgi:hypothetical protein